MCKNAPRAAATTRRHGVAPTTSHMGRIAGLQVHYLGCDLQVEVGGHVIDGPVLVASEQRDRQVGEEHEPGGLPAVVEAVEQGVRTGEVPAVPGGDDPGPGLRCLGRGQER
jgi:hypothetical protein